MAHLVETMAYNVAQAPWHRTRKLIWVLFIGMNLGLYAGAGILLLWLEVLS